MWHQICQRCKYTTSVDIQKRAIESYIPCRTTREHSESARERRTALYIKRSTTFTEIVIVQELCESRGGRLGCPS